MPRRLLSLFLLLLLAFTGVGGTRIYYRNSSQKILLRPLQLDPGNPQRRHVGALEFRAAWELLSNNGNFGGFSALVAQNDGRFIGVSDAGTLIGFGLSGNAETDRPFIAALPDTSGGRSNYRDRDSEGATRDPASGQIWISYEQNAAIRRFAASMSHANGIVHPKEMQNWPGNSGAEAIARLHDGRFLVFAEGSKGNSPSTPAILFSGDPVEPGTTTTHLEYLAPAGYRVTDCTSLPDGRLLLLHRRIGLPDGFSAKLAVVDPGEIAEGKTVKAQIIATLKSPLLVDNMEGLAVTQEAGETIVWMISDNNFNIIQRTLLMKFALKLPMKKPAAEQTAPGFESL